MSSKEDYDDLMMQAHNMPWGPTASALVAQAAGLAEANGMEEEAVEAYTHLTTFYFQGGEAAKCFAPFAWCLGRMRERPDLFSIELREQIGWHFKQVIELAIGYPQISLTQIDSMIEQMEGFYAEQSASLRPVYARKASLAGIQGDKDSAAHWRDLWRAAPRDELSDCPGCDPELELSALISAQSWQDAITMGEGIMSNEEATSMCEAQPNRTLSRLMESYTRLGRDAQAWAGHVRSYRQYSTNSRYVDSIYPHIQYLTLTGAAGRPDRLDRALRILVRHLPWWKDIDNADSLAYSAISAARLLQVLQSRGRGDEVLNCTIPASTMPWEASEDLVKVTIAQAGAYFEDLAWRIARRFDERHGHIPGAGGYSQGLQRWWDAPALEPMEDEGLVPDVSGLFDPLEVNYDVVEKAASPTELPTETPQDSEEEDPRTPVSLDGVHRLTDMRELISESMKMKHRPGRAGSLKERIVGLMVADRDLLSPPSWAPKELIRHWLYYAAAAASILDEGETAAVVLREAAKLGEELGEEYAQRNLRLQEIGIRLKTRGVSEDDVQKIEKENRELFTEIRELMSSITSVDGQGISFNDAGLGYWGVRYLVQIDQRIAAAELLEIHDEQCAASVFDEYEKTELLLEQGEALAALDRDLEACMAADTAMRRPSIDPLGTRIDALRILGVSSLSAGHGDEAVSYCREGLNLAAAAGLDLTVLLFSMQLSDALLRMGRSHEAAEVVQTALLRAEAYSGTHIYNVLRGILANVLRDLDDLPGAVENCLAVADWFNLNGSHRRAIENYAAGASMLAELGENLEQARIWGQITALHETLGEWGYAQRALRQQAKALVWFSASPKQAVAGMETAEGLMARSWELMHGQGSEDLGSLNAEEADWKEDYALLLWKVDRESEAITYAEESSELFLAAKQKEVAARPLNMVLHIYVEAGDKAGAQATIAKIREILPGKRWESHPARVRCDEVESQWEEE
ncbi:MAG: hypothetical protein Q4G30_01260 [Actinomycetaceae bacterium]|nr:hypothetical protein [Actinomycetaceae bacterium]